MTALLQVAGVGALIWILGVRSLFAQVEPTVTLRDGRATTVVRNSARDTMTVTVALWRALADSAAPSALVAPASFRLAPSEVQTVKLRAREPCVAGWRIVTTFTPLAPASAARVTRPVARLIYVTRIVGKLQCSP